MMFDADGKPPILRRAEMTAMTGVKSPNKNGGIAASVFYLLLSTQALPKSPRRMREHRVYEAGLGGEAAA
jgi:hypothetical protein